MTALVEDVGGTNVKKENCVRVVNFDSVTDEQNQINHLFREKNQIHITQSISIQ